jgi:hypothetical protein
MSSEPEPKLNPYASPALYEPRRGPQRIELPRPLIARGTIDWPTRRRAFQLVYGATLRDLFGLLGWIFVLGFVLLVIVALAFNVHVATLLWAVLALATCYMVARIMYTIYLAWRQHEQDAGVELHRIIQTDGIHVRGSVVGLIPWTSYSLCRQRGDLIVLIVGDLEGFQIFPRSHFASAADWGLFCRVVEHYVRCI